MMGNPFGGDPGPGTTTTTTTSSTTTSPPSPSTPSAPAGPSPEQLQAAIQSYAVMLQNWGIEISPEVENFLKHAVQNGWNSSQFLSNLRMQKFYALAFPGLMRANGTPRMSEAQYIAGFRQAKDYAASKGRNLSKDAYGLALKNGNSPTEIRQKIDALDILKENKQVFGEFEQVLQAAGELGPKGFQKDELLKFVMHKGPKAWEQVWQTAYSASQIEQAGITVGPGQDIGYKKLQNLMGQAPPGTDFTKLDYSQLAIVVHEIAGPNALYKAGIRGKDLVKMTFGGPQAEPIRQRVLDVLATYQARFDPQAEPQLNQGGLMTGVQQVQATE